ncbi:MAG TPA: serine/threonine-protein kinase [Kofleriaceae bacterium]|nr:serine/threonine-protein kinase [Kofleriaceae bacterium]
MGDDAKPTVVDRPGRVGSAPESVTAARPEPKPHALAGRYQAGDEIARGGMGRVVEATDTVLERVVAVKEALTDDPETLRRFARETKITARLEHPSIVPVYDAARAGEPPFYVMRRVSGRPLSELIAKAPTLEERLALVPHVLAAAQAVAHAHSRGIIHRDIKPTNILVGEHGETVVIDWGLAKVIGEPDPDDPYATTIDAGDSLRTRAGVVFGTPGFMSPSQVRGEPTGPAGDVYALGATLYYTLAGRTPHHANTADEIMQRTVEGPPLALPKLVPGVPAELATIVETALASEDWPGARRGSYPDAGAFAEDLRRFSTGQLVASHRYTPRERLVRFVRKHRAAVAIAALALAVLVVVGVFAIVRVLDERDRADAQARAAVQARQTERERADQLLLMRARMLSETNPTAAVALLKQLPESSPRLTEARGLLAAARMRGIAWGMEASTDLTVSAELDLEATQLLQVTRGGLLRIWDVRTRRLVLDRQLARDSHATWLSDNRVLVFDGTAPATLDVASGRVTALALAHALTAKASEDGKHAILVDDEGGVHALDTTTHALRPMWPGHKVKDVAIARDGSWFAASDGHVVAMLDGDGSVLSEHAVEAMTLYPSTRHIAFIVDRDVFTIEAVRGAPLVRQQLGTTAPMIRPVSLVYRGDQLLVMMSGGGVLRVSPTVAFEIARLETASAAPQELGTNTVVLQSTAATLLLIDEARTRRLELPHPMKTLRIATRRGHDRIAIVAEGLILVYELADVLPLRIATPGNAQAAFASDNLVMMWRATEPVWTLVELATGTRRDIPLPTEGFPRNIQQLPTERRVLVDRATPRGQRLEEIDLARGKVQLISDDVVISDATLIEGGGVIFTDGKRGFVSLDGKRRELAEMPREIRGVLGAGRGRYAVFGPHGDVVRGDIATGAQEHHEFADDRLIAVTDVRGTLVLATGRRVLRWGAQIEELVTLDSDVVMMHRIASGVFVTLANHTAAIVDTSVQHPAVRLVAQAQDPIVSFDGKLIALRGPTLLEIIETTTGARWTTPIEFLRAYALLLSPSNRQLMQQNGLGDTWIWQLAALDVPWSETLDRLTNATEDADGVLVWPWQHTR